MKRIGIISDTHGDASAIRACAILGAEADEWYHLGDHASDTEILRRYTDKPIYSVQGNCDFNASIPLSRVMQVEGRRVLLMHGHGYGVAPKYTYRACLYAEEQECDVLLYGHTHVSEISTHGSILIVNPGSPSQPRGGRAPSFAMMKIDGSRADARIIGLDKRFDY